MVNKNELIKSQVVELLTTTEILGRSINMYGTIENPLFLAKDVAEWVDYSKSNGKYQVSAMLRKIDAEEKGIKTFTTLGGKQEAWFLTEDGLYEACMKSTKPIAKQMKSEIKKYLKSIRLTGGVVKIDSEEQFIENYFPSLSEDTKKSMVLDLQKSNKEMQEHIEKLTNDNKALSGEILTWGNRKNLNAGIRKLATITRTPFGEMWGKLYKQLEYKYSINLTGRNNGKKPYIENIREDEWDKVIKSFSAICDKYDQSPSDMFQGI